jgi:TolB-like protein
VGQDGDRNGDVHDSLLFTTLRPVAARRYSLGTVSLTAGTRLGPYEVLGQLGRGAMGEVYRARDTRLGREVALKVVAPEIASDPESLRRFEREARAVASLSHPHIVPVFDVGEQNGLRYVVTELVEGETLRALLAASPLPANDAALLGAQIAAGLACAHERGVIHRDVKPENIMVGRDGTARIVDFGLAGRQDRPFGAASETEATASLASAIGVVAGTPAYMSPEQVRGEKLDARSDIFSLGAVLYEALTGERPFRGGSTIETLTGILKEEPDYGAPGRLLPAPLERILRRCLAKRKEDRYHSAADLAHDLRAVAASPAREARARRPLSPPAGRRLGLRALAVAAAGLAVLLLPRLRSPGASPRTLAVLPFRVIGVEAAPHLGLGLADSVIGRLASLRQLTVRPTSAISRFEAAPADAMEAGKHLKVEVVLEGTLQKLEGSTRVSVQLTDVSRGAIVWSDRIDLPEGRLFEIQDAIARGVVDRLRIKIDRSDRSGIGPAQPVPDDVMEEYFTVRARLSEAIRMQPEERRQMVERLDRILDRVPDFARALGARAYARAWFSFQSPSPGGHEAVLADAERALELDPGIAEPRLARALAYWSSQGGWKLAEAVRELKAAIATNPGLEFAHLDLSRILQHYGFMSEARQALEPARRLNPAHAELQRNVATILWYSGDLGAALAQYRRIPPQLLRGALGGRWQLLHLRLQIEDPRPLLTEALAWVAEGPSETPLPLALLAVARVLGGQPDISDLERRIRLAAPRIGHFHHVYHLLAEAHAQKGDAERSVSYLRQAAATGFPCLVLFESDPLLAPIRGSVQYLGLRRELERMLQSYRAQLGDVSPARSGGGKGAR